MKKILFVANYYYPYISGVSECLRIVAEGCAKAGYPVTVVTTNHAKLPANETINGVTVIRCPIMCKISKGVVSPAFILKVWRMTKQYDIINLHLPMLEAGLFSLFVNSSKLFTTYQCDINLKKSIINQLIVRIMDVSNNYCLKRSNEIIVSSIDYAMSSRIAAKYKNKLIEIAPPAKHYERIEGVRENHVKTIGFCGRIVEEKGLDVLLKAFKIVANQFDSVKLLIAGDYENIAGGSTYPQLIDYISKENLSNIMFLGKIAEEKMSEFYSSLDVFTLPSINSLEAFGMVQIEAMNCGTPVVASDLPGVRTIVQNTGMGLICKKNDAQSLAQCICTILNNPAKYTKSPEHIRDFYSEEGSVLKYMHLFSGATNKCGE
jgi:glycosyltransferase involved in cell wall biosynthesis